MTNAIASDTAMVETREALSSKSVQTLISTRYLLITAAILACSAYLIINVHPATDDDWYAIDALIGEKAHIVRYAFKPWAHHWHPLFFFGPALALKISQVDYSILPIRVLNCLGLFASLCSLGAIARTLRLGKWPTVAGMALLTFHQVTEGVLRQWDSFGQIWGGAVIQWTLALMVASTLFGKRTWLGGPLAAAIVGLCTFVGVTGTERVLGTVAGSLALVILLAVARRTKWKIDDSASLPKELTIMSRDVWWMLFGMVLAVAVLLFIRASLGIAAESSGRYAFATIGGIARNVAQMTYAVVTPISTLATFTWWTNQNWVKFAVSMIATACCGVCLLILFFRSQRREKYCAVALVAATIAACFPMAFISHVSEHYLAAPAYFFSLLFALALHSGWSDMARVTKAFLRLGVPTYLSIHFVGFVTKESAAANNGRHDVRGGLALFAQMKHLPNGIKVAYVLDPGTPKYYSCYTSPSVPAVVRVEATRAHKDWVWSDKEPANVTVHLTRDGEFVLDAHRMLSGR